MPARLDHRIVPSRDRGAAAELLATILAVPWSTNSLGPFSPVYVNDGLTLDFDYSDGGFRSCTAASGSARLSPMRCFGGGKTLGIE